MIEGSYKGSALSGLSAPTFITVISLLNIVSEAGPSPWGAVVLFEQLAINMITGMIIRFFLCLIVVENFVKLMEQNSHDRSTIYGEKHTSNGN